MSPRNPPLNQAPISAPQADSHDFDVAILGAGMSGLTLAHDLRQQGLKVCLIDSYAHAGGNHISDDVDGMTFDIGAIFHWSDSKLFEMFPSLRDQCVPVNWRTDRINPRGAIVAYPYDYNRELLRSSPVHLARVGLGILKNRLFPPAPKNAESFLNYYLGRELVKTSGVGTFVERFYGLPANEISYEFAQARMIHITQGASLGYMAKKILSKLRRPRSTSANICLARPKSGFAAFYAAAAHDLTISGVQVQLNCQIRSLKRAARRFEFDTSRGPIKSSRVISTMPLIETAKFLEVDAADAPTSLPLHSLYFKFKGDLGFVGPILYNFQNTGRWKRLTLHSQYYGTKDGWSYFSVETTGRENEHDHPNTIESDFRNSIANVPILKGQLERVGYRRTAYAYPLYDQVAEIKKAALMAKLDAHGIETVGRQGRFDYLPITQLAIMRVRQFLARTSNRSKYQVELEEVSSPTADNARSWAA